MKLFFFSPKYIFNIAAISRTMEVFGFIEAYVHDTNGILTPESHNKAYLRKLNKTSSGAFSYITFHPVTDPMSFLKEYPHRKIASVVHTQRTFIHQFEFQENDLVLMGNETHGLEQEIIALCDHEVKIPQRGQTESLNLNVASTIFLYEYSRQKLFSL